MSVGWANRTRRNEESEIKHEIRKIINLKSETQAMPAARPSRKDGLYVSTIYVRVCAQAKKTEANTVTATIYTSIDPEPVRYTSSAL